VGQPARPNPSYFHVSTLGYMVGIHDYCLDDPEYRISYEVGNMTPTLLLTNLNRSSNGYFAYDSEPLYLLAVASILSSAVSRTRQEDHDNSGSGQRVPGYKRLLTVFIITNAIAGLCQLCGAIVLYSISLAKIRIGTSLRQGIFLVRSDHLRRAI
jgi:hypothetical protein